MSVLSIDGKLLILFAINNLNQYHNLIIMNYTLNFLKVITQIAVVATTVFILPAVLHAVISFDLSYYLADIQSGSYQYGMGFVTVITTVIYCFAYSMHKDELANKSNH